MIPRETLQNTLVDIPRLENIVKFLLWTQCIAGNNAEVGVYKGGTAYLIASLSPKPLYLFDTFSGMPETTDFDLHEEGDFKDTCLMDVQDLLKFVDTKLLWHQGVFGKNEFRDSDYGSQIYSFVHLDCDLYESIKNALEFFYPRMSPGGIICLDDYSEPNCPGAKLAVDEFLADKPEKIFSTCQSQAAVRKE